MIQAHAPRGQLSKGTWLASTTPTQTLASTLHTRARAHATVRSRSSARLCSPVGDGSLAGGVLAFLSGVGVVPSDNRR
jgi:hypothetical protein